MMMARLVVLVCLLSQPFVDASMMMRTSQIKPQSELSAFLLNTSSLAETEHYYGIIQAAISEAEARATGASPAQTEDDLVSLRDQKRLVRRKLGELSCKHRGIGPTGGFCLDLTKPIEGANNALAVGMADRLFAFFRGLSVIDLGAGLGQYKAYWEALQRKLNNGTGPTTISAYDGAENIELASNGRVLWADLTEHQQLPIADWAVSLEVAEHIPAQQEGAYLDNLHRHNRRGIVMSWAVPGQAGHFHVNCQPAEAVISKLQALGYDYDDAFSRELRQLEAVGRPECNAALGDLPVYVCPTWFASTVYVFHKRNQQAIVATSKSSVPTAGATSAAERGTPAAPDARITAQSVHPNTNNQQQQSPRGHRHVVIELGSSVGDWMQPYLDEHPGAIPIMVEALPRFYGVLQAMAQKYGGAFYPNVAWSHAGHNMSFYEADDDDLSIGSSVYAAHVTTVAAVQPVVRQREVAVTSVDAAEVLENNTRVGDYIVLRMNIEGAEYEVLRRLIVSGLACRLSELLVHTHSMYSHELHRFYLMDLMLGWLLDGCRPNPPRIVKITPTPFGIPSDATSVSVHVPGCSTCPWVQEGAWYGFGSHTTATPAT